MTISNKPNDDLEVVMALADDRYHVWSENDQCIYTLTHQQLREEEEMGTTITGQEYWV